MRSGEPLRIDASTSQCSPSTVALTEPWFGSVACGEDSIVAMTRSTSKPSVSSRSWSAPFPDQQVPPVPCSSHASKKLSAVEPGSGPGCLSPMWISLRTLSNGTARHQAP